LKAIVNNISIKKYTSKAAQKMVKITDSRALHIQDLSPIPI